LRYHLIVRQLVFGLAVADMKTLLIVACAFFATAGANPICPFDPEDACNKCPFDRNWVQYVADDCDPNFYYSCYKIDGVIHYYRQQCDIRHHFSNYDWSCSIQTTTCPTNPPPVIVPIPTVPDQPDFWSIDFDKDWRETTYYNTEKSCHLYEVGKFWPPSDLTQTGLHTNGLGLVSHGFPCNIEVPYFQNNQFRQFTLCGMFKWFNGYGSIEMGLAFNGYKWECSPGSIRIHKTAGTDQIQASVTVESIPYNRTTTTILHPNSVDPEKWHKVCLRFDGSANGKSLELSVDDISVKKTGRGLLGLTVLKKCNLRLGEVLEETNGNYTAHSLYGIMDTWSFVPKIVDDSHFNE
jgi:hypothetical protein